MMEIEVRRESSSDRSTIGRVFVDGVFECFSLEDVVREVPGQPVHQWKVFGATAIPAGRYRILMANTQKFGRVPWVQDVPGYTGILIHCGNIHEHTSGCLLVGRTRAADFIGESRPALQALVAKIEAAIAAGDEVWITYVNGAAG